MQGSLEVAAQPEAPDLEQGFDVKQQREDDLRAGRSKLKGQRRGGFIENNHYVIAITFLESSVRRNFSFTLKTCFQ